MPGEMAEHKNLSMEISDVIAGAVYDWAHSSQLRSLSRDDMIARHVVRFIEERDSGSPQHSDPGMRIWIKGKPAPWGMGRQVRRGIRLKPQRLADWQTALQVAWRRRHRSTCFSGPVSISLLFHTHRPHIDLDNLSKGAIDALKDVAFADDDLVYELHALKRPMRQGKPGAEISIAQYMGHVHPQHQEDRR